MARRVIEAGFPVTLWARRAASLEAFDSADFTRAASLAELGRDSDVVGVCVFAEDDVREVVTGPGGILRGMRPGGVILVHSTVSVDFVLGLERRCAAHGVIVMDVPVSGFRARAMSGQLTVMAGGPRTSFEAVLPILNTFGSDVEYLGPVGSGLKMKALNQALLLANFTSAALALSLGRELGLDRASTEKVLSSASGRSAGLDLLVGRILPDLQFAKLAEEIMVKDMQAFDSLCRSSEVDAGELRQIALRSVSAIEQLRNTLR